MKLATGITILLLCYMSASAAASPKTEGAALLNEFMHALLIDDYELSARTAAPFVHPHLRSKHGKTLSKDLREFSYRKAHRNAKYYSYPVRIVRIRRYDQNHYTGGPTPEPGKLYDLFIGRKDKATGLPAPIRIFFPKDHSGPYIVYLGNL